MTTHRDVLDALMTVETLLLGFGLNVKGNVGLEMLFRVRDRIEERLPTLPCDHPAIDASTSLCCVCGEAILCGHAKPMSECVLCTEAGKAWTYRLGDSVCLSVIVAALEYVF